MRIPQKIPYTILVFAPVAPASPSGYGTKPVSADLQTLDDALGTFAPQLTIPVPKQLCPQEELTVRMQRLKDFKPDGVIRNNAYLRHVLAACKAIDAAVSEGRSPEWLADRLKSEWSDVPVHIQPPVKTAPQKSKGSQVDDILSIVAAPSPPSAGVGSSSGGPAHWRSQIETLLAALLKAVFSHEQFRRYEACWRGIETLLKQGRIKQSEGLRLQIVPATADSLPAAMEKMTRRFVENRPDLILIDIPMNGTLVGTALLEKVVSFAEAQLIPTVCWVPPAHFDLDDWAGLKKLSYLKHHLEDTAFAKLRRVQSLSGSHWIALTCNRFLSRFAYGKAYRPKGVFFEEGNPLWISPVWAAGALAAQSVVSFGWPSRITRHTDIRLTDLALQDDADSGPRPTETILGEDRIMQFIEAGYTPLVGLAQRDMAIMPKASTWAGGSLAFQLFVSRLLTLLFWCRENLDKEMAGDELEQNLKTTLTLLWQQTGQEPPPDVSVTQDAYDAQGFIPLTIGLTPPRSVLPGGQRFEMTFNW